MLTLFSPAKINLFLRIVSKRSDGFHSLSSVFQTISLGDTLTIEPHTEDRLTCSDSRLPTDQSNLVLKATDLFRRKTGLNNHFKIHLIKRIPTQAGLGGGSSNAATVLWACNQLASSDIPLNTLKQWGAEIGSDIPFFLSQGTAYCTGKGESVLHLPSLTSKDLWIIKPAAGLSTPEVYKRFKLDTAVTEQGSQRDLERFLSGSLLPFNDLETPAFEINPALLKLRNELLDSGFETVLMSGSGSSFFCFGEGTVPKDPGLSAYPVRFINRQSTRWYE